MQLAFEKAKRDLEKAVVAPSGVPGVFRFVCRGNVSADMRAGSRCTRGNLSIEQCDIWSGRDFEERLRASAESLLRRFCQGIVFPDAANDLNDLVRNI